MTITRERDGEGNWQTILKNCRHFPIPIPIADIKPPEYIIGFEEIKFWHIDDHALKFVENILPLLNEVKITLELRDNLEAHPQIGPIKCLMEMLAPKTNKLELPNDSVDQFNQQFPNFIYGIQSISIFDIDETEMDLLVKWLTAPMKDGTPKILQLKCYYDHSVKKLLDRVKEEFVHSIEPVNFIISMVEEDEEEQIGFKDFNPLGNNATEEMLELQREESEDYFNPIKYFFVRHKNDNEAIGKVDEWKEQMKLESKTIMHINC